MITKIMVLACTEANLQRRHTGGAQWYSIAVEQFIVKGGIHNAKSAYKVECFNNILS